MLTFSDLPPNGMVVKCQRQTKSTLGCLFINSCVLANQHIANVNSRIAKAELKGPCRFTKAQPS